MFRFLIFRFSGRRAVSTMIGGVIILSLLLTALGTMVFVSQQYDQYQQSVNKMVQYGDKQQLENLVANSPGLTPVASNAAVPGWGICTSTTYICYNMTVSNLGGVGVQIVRIYINSTGSGCTSLCVLNPTASITSYAFNQANSYLNQGEVNHWLVLALPKAKLLPSYTFSTPPNTILIVTSRGNVFAFQWPFQILMGGQSQSAFSAGIMKIAYQYIQGSAYPTCTTTNPPLCYDSKNEPGPVAAGSGGSVTSAYCHQEPAQAYQAGPTYAEKLTVSGLTDNNLWFVSPWVTQSIFTSAQTNGNAPSGHLTWPSNLTTLYIYVNITNVGNTPFAINGGSIDLTWYSFNWLTANLIGYYQGAPPGTFYPTGTTHTVAAGQSFYGIFKVISLCLGKSDCSPSSSSTGTWPPPTGQSVMFLGSASLTSSTTNSTFIAGVALTSGLWIRYSCS
jgi:hypothetical protein